MCSSVSVIMPAYRDDRTIARALATICHQTVHNVEIIVVDSSPDDRCREIVTRRYPNVRYYRVRRRIWGTQAMQIGAQLAQAEILVFTDPDCYSRPDRIERLLAAAEPDSPIVSGAIGCFGRGWWARGVHLAKFSTWLPESPAKTVGIGPTANLLVRREVYESIGGLARDGVLGDIDFSYRARRLGYRIHFAPDAIVEHHHTQSLPGFVRERLQRGYLAARVRDRYVATPSRRPVLLQIASLLTRQLAGNLRQAYHDAHDVDWIAEFIRCLPIIALGHLCWRLGEAWYRLRIRRSGFASDSCRQ